LSTDTNADGTTPSSPTDEYGRGMSDRFRPLSAQKLIRAQLKGTAQHVALVLAGMTPPTGRLAITQPGARRPWSA
jgi:hypothetical protein